MQQQELAEPPKALPTEHKFKLHKTTIEINNLAELAEALEIMSDESYSHHVGPKKNDFAAWVKEIIQDEELAKRLIGVKERKQAHKIVRQRIKQKQTPVKSVTPASRLINNFFTGWIVGMVLGIFVALLVVKWILTG